MTSQRDGRHPAPQNPTLRCIASKHRRAILQALLTWGTVLTQEQLVEYLAAREQETVAPDAKTKESLQVELVHIHLPALEAADLIEQNPDTGRITTTTHPALADPRFKELVKCDSEDLDDVLLAVSHEYRRIALTVLTDEQPSLSRDVLAREILRRGDLSDPNPEAIERVSMELHHVHLPKLAQLNLLTYDSVTGRVTYTSHSTLETVFSLIYEPEKSLLEKVDDFFNELHDSYEQASPEPRDQYKWPHFWGDPHYG